MMLLGACVVLGCGSGAPPFQHESVLAGQGGTNPTTAVAGDGTTYVAWVGQDDSVTANVYLARSDGRGFAPPVRVNATPGDAAPHLQAPAQVFAGAGGQVYVAWQSTRPVPGLTFGAADVRFARSTDGGRTFEPPVSVNDDAGRISARHTFHDVAATADGTVYVSWIDARLRDSVRVEEAKKNRGGHAHGAGTGGMGRKPGEPGTDIRVARSTDGGKTFTAGVVVGTNSCTCCRTAMASGPDGAIYVAWRKLHAGDVNDIVVSRSSDRGETWGVPVKVHDDGWVFPGCPHAGPDIHVDAENALHAVWYTGAPGRQGLYYAVSKDGGRTFSDPVALTGQGAPVSQARLAAAGPDAVWITWEDRSADSPTLGIAWAGNDGRFTRHDRSALPGASPDLASGGEMVSIAWLDGESVRVRTSRQ